ncbi:MAG: nucleotidyltransferase family protein [Saccharofermentanales bacterium]
MNSAKADLLNHLAAQEQANSVSIGDNIIKSRLANMFSYQLKNDNKIYYASSLKMLNLQKVKDDLFLKEAKKINVLAEENDVEIIYLKGLFLAADLYENIYERIFGDMDMVIRLGDLDKTLKIFNETGYSISNDDLDDYSFDAIYKYITTVRHIEFSKECEYGNKKVVLKIELHCDLTNPPKVNNINMDDIFARSVRKKLLGCDIRILDVNDYIIYFAFHFMAHHYLNLSHLYSPGKPCGNFTTNLQQLYDIALFIDKYAAEISWDCIFKRCKEFGVCVHFAYVSKLFNEIFPGRIPAELTCMIADYMDSILQNGFECYTWLVSQALSSDAKKLILCDYSSLIEDIRQNNGISFDLCCYCDYNPMAKNDIIKIDENSPRRINYEDDSCKKSHCHAEGGFAWNQEIFFLHMTVFDDVLIFENKYGKKYVYEQDSIDLKISTGNLHNDGVIMHYYCMGPVLADGKYVLGVLDPVESVYTEEPPFKYRVEVFEDRYTVDIEMPWKSLNLEPFEGMMFYINIGINECCDFNKGSHSHIAWTGESNEWYTLKTFYRVKLEKFQLHPVELGL